MLSCRKGLRVFFSLLLAIPVLFWSASVCAFQNYESRSLRISSSNIAAIDGVRAAVALSMGSKGTKENWTFNPLDMDDLSPLDTLLRRGVIPLGVRIFKENEYEEAVVKYMEKDGCDRSTAQRNMDAYFNDPNGWIMAKQRERVIDENIPDINAPTGVQKRPVFSVLWASFCFWLFFVFFPTRIEELGGVKPVIPSNGICRYPVETVDGKKCPESDKFLDQYYIQESLEKNQAILRKNL